MNDTRSRFALHARTVQALLIALALGVGLHDLSRSWYFPLQRELLDLRVFYCAGSVAGAGANPYAIEPLRTCEHRIPNRLLTRSPNLVLPFVLPGYDLVPLELLAREPFGPASTIYTACSIAALLASIVLIARTTRVSPLVTAAALGLSVGFPSVLLGQTAAFELLALALTAWALAERRERWAGAFAAAALLEPHVGIFTVVAVALLVPRARATLAISLIALTGIALAADPLHQQLVYLGQGLAQHAYAEVHSQEQYSLAYVLALAGVPDRAALAIGGAMSLLMLAASIPVARACARRGQRGAIAFVPAAFALVGGTFVHITQEALAIPAALVLVGLARTRLARALAGAAVTLLAIPWQYPTASKQLLVLTLLCVALTVWFSSRGGWRPTLAAVAVCYAALFWTENHPPRPNVLPVVRHWPASTPIAIEWRSAMDQMSLHDPFRIAVKVPTWCGLLGLVGAGMLLLRDEREDRSATRTTPA